MAGFMLPEFPQITINSALSARQKCPVLKALVPGPRDQALYALRQINPVTVGISIGVGFLASRLAGRSNNAPQNMREPNGRIVLTQDEKDRFNAYEAQERSKFIGDAMRSHPLTEEASSAPPPLEAAQKPTLNEASTYDLMKESVGRLGQGLWSLCDYSASTASYILSNMWTQATTQSQAVGSNIASYIWPEPAPDTSNAHQAPATQDSIASHQIKRSDFDLAADINTEKETLGTTTGISLPAAHDISASNIVIGKPLPEVIVNSSGLITTNGSEHGFEAWSPSNMPTGHLKILAFLPAKPHRKEQLQAFGDAIEDRDFSSDSFKSYTVVNVSDNPGQTGVLGGIGFVATGFRNMVKPGAQGSVVENLALSEIIKGAKKRPEMAIIADKPGTTRDAWGLDLDTCYTFVLDEENNVMTALKGKPSKAEEKSILDWCETKIQNNTLDQANPTQVPKKRSWWPSQAS